MDSFLQKAAHIAGVIAALAALVDAGINFSHTKSAEAAPRTFSCKMVSGAWTTILKENDRPERQLIRWTSDFGGKVGYTPERRCNEVTQRMNLYFSNSGHFITHGMQGREKVICITNLPGKDCLNLLYTLKPDQDAKATLEDLFGVNKQNISREPLREGRCATYISVDALLAGQTRFAQEACFPR